MTRRATRQYRKVQLESAPPPRLLLEVFRRLDEDLQRTRRCLASRDIAGKARAVDHALALLGQLEGALDHDLSPELCRELAATYGFARGRFLLASVRLDAAPLDEVERVLRPIRDAFEQVIDGKAPPRP